MKEIWKEHPIGVKVSNLGRVFIPGSGRKYPNGHITYGHKKKTDGYMLIGYNKKIYYVHILVGQCFIPNPNNYPDINHKDEDKTNNCIENLEWTSRKYNCNYGTRNKRGAEKRSKPILQYDLDGNFIKEWSSMTEAEKQLGFKKQGIIKNLKEKTKSAYHFKWKYKNIY